MQDLQGGYPNMLYRLCPGRREYSLNILVPRAGPFPSAKYISQMTIPYLSSVFGTL